MIDNNNIFRLLRMPIGKKRLEQKKTSFIYCNHIHILITILIDKTYYYNINYIYQKHFPLYLIQ